MKYITPIFLALLAMTANATPHTPTPKIATEATKIQYIDDVYMLGAGAIDDPGPPVPYALNALLDNGALPGVGDIIQAQSPAPVSEGLGVAALPGVGDPVVNPPQKDITGSAADGAGIYVVVRQPDVLPPDRIVPGGQGRRQQGREDKHQEHTGHTLQSSRSAC